MGLNREDLDKAWVTSHSRGAVMIRRRCREIVGHRVKIRLVNYEPIGDGGSANIASTVLKELRGSQSEVHASIVTFFVEREPLKQLWTRGGLYPYYSVDFTCIYDDEVP